MRSFWSDPYLWIHLAGLAAFPLFLEGCLVGFAIGDPLLPVWLELLLVAAAGIAPILWMQWQRPFYIFSLVAVAVKPEKLTDDQRRLLTLFKRPRGRILAVLVTVLLIVVLRQVYEVAPIAAPVLPFPTEWRLVGLLLAAVAFLACNLFVQVPVSVASVMLTSESTFAATNPQPLERIQQDFTLVGLRLNQIVPPLVADPKPVFVGSSLSTSAEAAIVLQNPTDSNSLANDVWEDATASSVDNAKISQIEEVSTSATEASSTEPAASEVDLSEPDLPELNSSEPDLSEPNKSLEPDSTQLQ